MPLQLEQVKTAATCTMCLCFWKPRTASFGQDCTPDVGFTSAPPLFPNTSSGQHLQQWLCAGCIRVLLLITPQCWSDATPTPGQEPGILFAPPAAHPIPPAHLLNLLLLVLRTSLSVQLLPPPEMSRYSRRSRLRRRSRMKNANCEGDSEAMLAAHVGRAEASRASACRGEGVQEAGG